MKDIDFESIGKKLKEIRLSKGYHRTLLPVPLRSILLI